MPLFFFESGVLLVEGLFGYLVVSGVSSSLMVVGFLCENYLFLVIVGLLVKFGVFPFFGWVYRVICGSN